MEHRSDSPNSIEVESTNEIKQKLAENYASAKLPNNEPYSIVPDIKVMNSCSKDSEGVYQDLLMVIKAGDDFFSLVEVFAADRSKATPSGPKSYAITRRRPGQRAELIGFVDPGEEPMVVGRTSDSRGFSPKLSRQHFALGIHPEDGHIDIIDTSSNGTEIFVSLDEHSRLNNSDPVKDISFWSVKSTELRDSLLSHAAA